MFKRYDSLGIALEVGGIAGMISSGSVQEMIPPGCGFPLEENRIFV